MKTNSFSYLFVLFEILVSIKELSIYNTENREVCYKFSTK